MFYNSLKLIQKSSVSLLTLCLSQTAQAAPVDLFFSEYVEGSSYNKALEIYNGTGATINLTGNYIVEMYYNGKTTADLTIPLSGTILSGDVFVVRPTDATDATIIAQADQTYGIAWFNGDDALILKKGGANGTILDSIGQKGFDPGTKWGSSPISTEAHTLRRKPTVCHGDTNPNDAFDPAKEWDGFPQNTFDGLGSHTYPSTKIHTLQGNGMTSLEVGKVHIIQGVVIGDFQTTTQLNGFFVQEEASDADTDPTTSEGIFVYDNNIDVSVGQVVRVQGTVQEFYGLTELAKVTSVSICGDGASVTPTPITLPLTSNTVLEHYEGMLVKLPQTLTVTDNYNLGRYGEVVLANGRLLIPTMTTTPGTAANTLQAQNNLNRLLMDDGSLVVNPPLIPYPGPSLSATQTLRSGDTVTGVTGVLDYSFDQYRLHPTSPPAFVATNPRPSSPVAVGGTLKIASFNLDNYFNTFGCVSCRGAENATEFTRQRDKIINALKTTDADIVGLMEVENDGYGTSSAFQDLVNGLNAVTSPGTYTFVDADAATGMTNALGYDAIKVAMLYKPTIVTLVGAAKALNTGAYANQNRPPLAQTFQHLATGGKLTVVVNHFKSRGSNTSGSTADDDKNDGQGMSNATRTAAARDLTAWLATDPTGSGDSNFLLIGDLNAYALEDPLMAIKSAGYTDLVQKFMGANAYSYIYDGEAGYIDHALTSANLLPRVTGVTEWHIDADEPSVLDYNENDKSVGQLTSLYTAAPYRASDHDPLIIGLSLTDSPPAVVSTTPPTGATNIAIDADMAISFNESVMVTDSSFTINCSSSGVHPVMVSGNGANYTLNPTPDFANNETCTVTVLATQVSDVDTNDPPDQMTTDYSWQFTTITPPPTPAKLQSYLFVSVDGSGQGRVISDPQGIDCSSDKCQYPYDQATQVTLTPIPADGSKFSSWGGNTDCVDGEVIMTSNKLCIAFFALLPPPSVTLTVTKSGTGTGIVASLPAGIDCGTTCAAAFNVATPVTLQVTPDANSQFIGFNGDEDCSDGNVTLNTAATCNALFELLPTVTSPPPTPVTFNLTLQVTGKGSVTSSPAGIDCGTIGTANYLSGTPVNLTALPAEGYQFTGFTGDESCAAGQFNLATNVTCVANFIEVVAADLPKFVANHYEIPADAKVLTIAIQRPTGTTSSLTVNYATQDDTAIAGRDYVATTGNVTWTEGDKTDKIITITLLRGEQKVVPEEKVFSMVLTDAKGTQLDTTTVSLLAGQISPPPLPESPLPSSPQLSEPIPETTGLLEPANIKTPELLPESMPVPTSEPVPTATLVLTPSDTMPVLTTVPTIEEASNPVWLIDNPRCPTEGWLDWVCNAQWQTLHNLEIGIHGILSSGILEGTINNQGWVSNLIIKPQSLVIGGVVTGYITNQGQMIDFEFVGMSVKGGTLSGTIRNNSLVGGYFQDVHLAANTHIRGGKLRGDIIGDINAPALLEDLVIAEGSRLVGVKIGKRVRLAKGVKY
jgi:hypothetical protein